MPAVFFMNVQTVIPCLNPEKVIAAYIVRMGPFPVRPFSREKTVAKFNAFKTVFLNGFWDFSFQLVFANYAHFSYLYLMKG